MADVTPEVTDNMNFSLQSRVAELPWHHSIDLGNGVVTPGGKSLGTCNAEASLIFDRVDLHGRTVLDVGAWNGFFSFEAKRRGASRVLATDSYCWSHPHIHGRETFDIARTALGVDINAREIDVADLSTEAVGEFGIVLYLGVFYHRYDAIEALTKVAPLAKQLLIVETHLELRDIDIPAMALFPGRELANDPTNWWGPNEHCMKALLQGHGFKDIEMTAHPAGHNRAIFHAWRSTEARLKPVDEGDRLRPLPESRRLAFVRRHPVLAGVGGLLMNMRPPDEKIAPRLEPLLDLRDEEFVTEAYKMVLCRAPDQDGMAYYLAQLRSGVRKDRIIVELAQSAEGRLRSADLPAIREILREHRRRDHTLWSRLLRMFSSANLESTDRQLRVLDNQLYLLDKALAMRTQQLADLFVSMHRTAQEPTVCPEAPEFRGAISRGSVPSAESMSPAARDIFSALARASAPHVQDSVNANSS